MQKQEQYSYYSLTFTNGYCIGEHLSSSACRVKAAIRCLAFALVGIKAERIKEIKAQECLSGVVQVDLGLQKGYRHSVGNKMMPAESSARYQCTIV